MSAAHRRPGRRALAPLVALLLPALAWFAGREPDWAALALEGTRAEKRMAAAALASARAPEELDAAVEHLLRMYRDEGDAGLRLAAVAALQELAPRARPQLVVGLSFPGRTPRATRELCARLLADQGEDALDPLLAALLDERHPSRFHLNEAFLMLGESAVPRLVGVLREGDIGARHIATTVLGGMGEEAADACETIYLTGSPELSPTRRAALKSLAQIDLADERTRRLAEQLSDDPAVEIRKEALQTLFLHWSTRLARNDPAGNLRATEALRRLATEDMEELFASYERIIRQAQQDRAAKKDG